MQMCLQWLVLIAWAQRLAQLHCAYCSFYCFHRFWASGWNQIILFTIEYIAAQVLTVAAVGSSQVGLSQMGASSGRLWCDVVSSSGSTGWQVMSFTRNLWPLALEAWPILNTCPNKTQYSRLLQFSFENSRRFEQNTILRLWQYGYSIKNLRWLGLMKGWLFFLYLTF